MKGKSAKSCFDAGGHVGLLVMTKVEVRTILQGMKSTRMCSCDGFAVGFQLPHFCN